jgi:formate hydrogenlyase subunit 3/multisubunit Na+/H+ antiporter MnhD subunit
VDGIEVVLLPLFLLLAFGCASLVTTRKPALSHAIGAAGAALGSLVGLVVTVTMLLRGVAGGLSLSWNPAIGASFSIGFDPLSGFFLIAIYALCGLGAVFGHGYLRHFTGTRGLGSHWLFYAFLAASMALVVLARNAVLFLVSWEVMSLSSWLLVTFEHEKEEVRSAGITYLVATQIGTAFLLVMFMLLGATATQAPGVAALDFAGFAPSGLAAGGFAPSGLAAGGFAPGAGVAAAVFLLALVGFGTKAGIVPLHVWLPEAHPAAPSHVSAVMSGVMIKTGIYGLLRVLTFLGAPPAWWGWTMLLIGAASGVIGVLFALAQHDIKRLLAYHSVENIGIICIGIGVGLLGISYGSPVMAVLGFAGGILHVINHALFKGLLFLGAGAAAEAAGTRDMDRLGGLLRRMPWTGSTFFLGSVAICGLPPLNGFVSELLIFLGAFAAVALPAAAPATAGAIAIGALALISGLACACFTKAFGIVFLGEPRSEQASAAGEPAASMVVPLVVLASACAAVGILGWLVVGWLSPLAASMAGVPPDTVAALVSPARVGLLRAILAAGGLAVLVGLLTGVRVALQRGRPSARSTVTWDCGYARPTARMQYTSSSFAQPLVAMFRGLLATRRHAPLLDPLFPVAASFSTHTPDVFSTNVILPGLRGAASLFSRLRWLQHGRLQLYVLYIAAALIILLAWRLA